jgi:hypothetical protein
LEAKVVGVTVCESDWQLRKTINGTVVQRIELASSWHLKYIREENALAALRRSCGIVIDKCNVFLEVYALSFPRNKSSEGAVSVKASKLL